MKIDNNTSQNITQKELKTPEIKSKNKNIEQDQKVVDKNEVKMNPLAQNIKDINTNIGRLQVAQNTLNTIEPDAKKYATLAQEGKETLEKNERDDIKNEMTTLKKNIDNTFKKALFEGNNVFSQNIKDRNNNVIFDAKKLNPKLLDSDAQKFYDTLKDQQVQVKDAIKILQDDAQDNTQRIANGKTTTRNVQSTEGSFLKKFGDLFRVSHDTNKLSESRVQELLA